MSGAEANERAGGGQQIAANPEGMPRMLATLVVVTVVAGAALASPGYARPRAERAPSPIIAIIENNGVNVLHSDFALAPGERLVLPPGMPKPTWVSLPTSGTFEQQLEAATAGPFGNLTDDTLYWVRATRLGIYIPKGSDVTDIFASRVHATGTVSSAIGRKHGTNPHALAIIVPDAGPRGWEWLSEQGWIDIVSTSYFGASVGGDDPAHGTCPATKEIREIVEQGRLVFSAAGNVEQAGFASAPSGATFTYQVGGVDDQDRTYLPGPNNQGQSVTPTRPYETGDRFDFPAADSESLDGSMAFGGTSGATPSTAGRAAELLTFARDLLGSSWTGVRDGALVIASSTSAIPRRGPLADGRLERQELAALLHHVATPAEPPSPARYLVEGYGALNEEAVALAKRVLTGSIPESERPEEDAMHEQVESLRSLLFPAARCG